ncbi:MAG: hypothetical protein AAF352_05445 [Pseudomonadota bacterium]
MNQETDFQDRVYGATFEKYGTDKFEEFLAPLKLRLQRNGLDGDTLFSGKTCLDVQTRLLQSGVTDKL